MDLTRQRQRQETRQRQRQEMLNMATDAGYNKNGYSGRLSDSRYSEDHLCLFFNGALQAILDLEACLRIKEQAKNMSIERAIMVFSKDFTQEKPALTFDNQEIKVRFGEQYLEYIAARIKYLKEVQT